MGTATGGDPLDSAETVEIAGACDVTAISVSFAASVERLALGAFALLMGSRLRNVVYSLTLPSRQVDFSIPNSRILDPRRRN
jgi:hypothetical protein